MNKKTILLLLVFIADATFMSAQDTNEFQRIARRIMNAYDVGDELEHAPDSANFYGGAYLGAGTNGHTMPSAYVTYLKKEKLLITGQLAIDISKLNTEKDVTTDYHTGADRLTHSDILTKSEKQDFSIRLDYSPSKPHILTFGIIESLNTRRVEESTIRNGHEVDGSEQESYYEEQHRNNRDLKLGALLQHICDFNNAGRLTTRLNIKYNYNPTDVSSDTWAAQSPTSLREQTQTLYNFDPYAMIRFQSKSFGSFRFGLEEKYTIEDMRISDTATRFNFNTYSSLTTLSANYSHAWLGLDATLRYEHFINDIDDHQAPVSDRIYNDWMLSAKATIKLNKANKFVLSFDRDISRPTYTQLYPFVHIGSSIGVIVVGNPALDPSTHSAPHFTHTQSLAYKRITDDISQIPSFDEASQRSVKTWINDARYSYLRYNAEGQLNYGLFSMTMVFNAQHLNYDGESGSSDKAWSYSFKVRPQVELPKGWTLATTLLYTGRETHRYYYDQSNLYWSVRAVKQMENWAIYAFVQDILQPDAKQILRNNDYDMTTVTKPNSRCLIVGCSYIF